MTPIKPWTEPYLQLVDSRMFNYVLSCSVAKSCPTLCHPMDCSPPGSAVHGILQARILEWVAISFSRGSSHIPCISSVAQLCPILCDPMDCSMPGFPVHHQLTELAQTHVHPVSDAIQSSHPLASLSSPAFNLSQHQGLFK